MVNFKTVRVVRHWVFNFSWLGIGKSKCNQIKSTQQHAHRYGRFEYQVLLHHLGDLITALDTLPPPLYCRDGQMG